MKLIDKLLIKARAEYGQLYYIIGVIVPCSCGYDADIRLYKRDNVIKQTTGVFIDRNKVNELIYNISKEYNLKSDDAIICYMDFGEE